jgi:hypothetical protein
VSWLSKFLENFSTYDVIILALSLVLIAAGIVGTFIF